MIKKTNFYGTPSTYPARYNGGGHKSDRNMYVQRTRNKVYIVEQIHVYIFCFMHE